MKRSREIAQIAGPTLIAITLSELLNLRIWAVNIPAVIYLNGTLLFVGGLSIVRIHNTWTHEWPVLVTLIGWSSVLLGLVRMFAPGAQAAATREMMYAGIALLFVIGVFLTFKGYMHEGRRGDLEEK